MNYSNRMDLTEEVKTVEKELVDLIIAHLKSNSIAVEAARQQARDFLALLPVKDQKDLLDKLKGLGDKYVEAKTVYAEELGKVNEVERQQTLETMRSHISSGNIDAAIAAAKAMYPPKEEETVPAETTPVAPAVSPTPAEQNVSAEASISSPPDVTTPAAPTEVPTSPPVAEATPVQPVVPQPPVAQVTPQVVVEEKGGQV